MTTDALKIESIRLLTFAAALNKTHVTASLWVTAYNCISRYARSRIPAAEWPELLP